MRLSEVIIYEELGPFSSQSLNLQRSSEDTGEVHLFTGPNGTGKSRLMAAMAGIGISPSTSLKKNKFDEELEILSFSDEVKLISLADPKRDFLKVRMKDQTDSRAIFAFKCSSTLQTTGIDLFSESEIPPAQERLSFQPWIRSETNKRIVEFKIQAAMESLDATDDPSEKTHSVIKVEEAISKLTGMEFAVITQKRPKLELMFKWGQSRLPVSGLPDGLSSILSWVMDAATLMDLIYPDSLNPLAEPAIFFLDEPETHLHPQWQRQIIPLAQEIFSGSQIFIATHSPFVVSSLNEGSIYQLKKNQDGKVTIDGPHPASKGDSYISATERFLETGEWFDPESEKLLSQFREARNKALDGDSKSRETAVSLGLQLSGRSQELANIIGPEISQLERLLSASK